MKLQRYMKQGIKGKIKMKRKRKRNRKKRKILRLK
jgi:hypothetical protein